MENDNQPFPDKLFINEAYSAGLSESKTWERTFDRKQEVKPDCDLYEEKSSLGDGLDASRQNLLAHEIKHENQGCELTTTNHLDNEVKKEQNEGFTAYNHDSNLKQIEQQDLVCGSNNFHQFKTETDPSKGSQLETRHPVKNEIVENPMECEVTYKTEVKNEEMVDGVYIDYDDSMTDVQTHSAVFGEEQHEEDTPTVPDRETTSKGEVTLGLACISSDIVDDVSGMGETQSYDVRSVCNKTHKTYQRYIRNHTSFVKQREKPHHCSFCKKSFHLAAILKRHIRTHKGEKSHQCSLCYKSFAEASNLKRHIRTHTVEGPHPCSFCKKSFYRAVNLKKHLMTHTGEKSHQCSFCNKSFSAASILKRHVMIHTKSEHQCSFCNKRFSDASMLKRHVMIHTGEKPHLCSFCNKSFTQASILKRHFMIHTGEKPHLCSFCKKSFTQASNLNRHMKTHTASQASQTGFSL